MLFTSFALFASNSEIQVSYAIAVFHENGNGEKYSTQENYRPRL